MKVTKIKLNDYLHFKKGLEIDLTYPEEHEKAGQPLEKVCFLGQSGTGKTTLLEVIKFFICENKHGESYCIDLNKIATDAIEICCRLGSKKYIKSSVENNNFKVTDLTREPAEVVRNVGEYEKELETFLKECRPLLLNFPFSVVLPSHLEKYTTEIQQKEVIMSAPVDEINDKGTNIKKSVWDFSSNEISQIWNIVFARIAEHIEKSQIKKIELFNGLMDNTANAAALKEEYQKWERDSSNRNPLESLADKCLNPILDNFQLFVETNLSEYETNSQRSAKHIRIKSKVNGEEIKYNFLSTGTKQIMLTAIPLYYIEPKNSIILFDQPETSLYPNVQSLLPEVYISAAQTNNQFFFATHSPVIASAFDPWEIVELQFDHEDGTVYRKEYYRGERKVVNFFINPKLLTWTDNYTKLFDVKDRGGKDRIRKLTQLSEIEQEIKAESDSEKKAVLIEKYKKNAELLNWELNIYA